MAGKKLSALTPFIKQLKSETKAEKSPSATLKKIIDDYCTSGNFDSFLHKNKSNIEGYIADQGRPRSTRHRASQVGKCAQASAFALANKLYREAQPIEALGTLQPTQHSAVRSIRPARQYRALYNGTFFHLRMHIMFDALHEQGIVRTLYAENLAYNEELSLSGTVDRVVEFDYLGKVYRGVIDYKSIKSRDFDHLIKPQTDHVWQQHAYDLLGLYEAHGFIMLYENKDTHDLKVFDRPYDEILRYKIIRELKQIDEYAVQVINGVPIENRINLPLIVTWCRYCSFEMACKAQHPDLEEQQARIGDDDDDEDDVKPSAEPVF